MSQLLTWLWGTEMPPPCLALLNLRIQVQVFTCIWCLSPFLSRQPAVCFDWDGSRCGGSDTLQPRPRSWGLGDWSEKHVMVRVKWGPGGNRRLTRAASCLSCFVKAANLPFVAADSSDKQERKWRIFRDGNKIRSGGGGRAFPWGMGSSQEDLCILHVKPPREPGSTFICRPTFVVVLEVRFLGCTSSPASTFQGALMTINWRCTIASFRHMILTTALQWMQECWSMWIFSFFFFFQSQM